MKTLEQIAKVDQGALRRWVSGTRGEDSAPVHSKKAILEQMASDLEALDPLWLDDDIAQLILDVRKVASRAGAD